MKKRGFGKQVRIKIDWEHPGAIFTLLFFLAALLSALIITFADGISWKSCGAIPIIFAVIGGCSLLAYLATRD